MHFSFLGAYFWHDPLSLFHKLETKFIMIQKDFIYIYIKYKGTYRCTYMCVYIYVYI